jgi:hypothetical protein
MKLLCMVMVQNYTVMLGHMLNHCVELYSFVQCNILVKQFNFLSVCPPLTTFKPHGSNLLQHF